MKPLHSDLWKKGWDKDIVGCIPSDVIENGLSNGI